jgi:hypothetical protein
MGIEVRTVTSDGGGLGPQEAVVGRLTLRGGDVLIEGKLVVYNLGSEVHRVIARLTHLDGSIELDQVDVTTPIRSVPICLIGWITNASDRDIVDLRCAAPSYGAAYQFRLTATFIPIS